MYDGAVDGFMQGGGNSFAVSLEFLCTAANPSHASVLRRTGAIRTYAQAARNPVSADKFAGITTIFRRNRVSLRKS